MAVTLTPAYTFSSGDTVTPTRLNNASTITITAATNSLLGTTGTTSIAEITCTSAGRAILDDASASDQRTTLGLGTMATQDATDVAVTGGDIKAEHYALAPSTLSHAATVTADFSTAAATMQTVTVTSNTTLATANLAAGRCKVIRLVGDTTARTISCPSWKFMGASAPTSLAANKTGRLNLESWGTSDASVIAFYSVEL